MAYHIKENLLTISANKKMFSFILLLIWILTWFIGKYIIPVSSWIDNLFDNWLIGEYTIGEWISNMLPAVSTTLFTVVRMLALERAAGKFNILFKNDKSDQMNQNIFISECVSKLIEVKSAYSDGNICLGKLKAHDILKDYCIRKRKDAFNLLLASTTSINNFEQMWDYYSDFIIKKVGILDG